MALNGIKGKYPLSLNDQGRESSGELLTMPAEACVVILSHCHVSPHLLEVLGVYGLWTLHDMNCVKVVRSSFSLPITWHLYGVLQLLSYGNV